MKNNFSDEVGHATLMIYHRILGAGRSDQNMFFLSKLAPQKIESKNRQLFFDPRLSDALLAVTDLHEKLSQLRVIVYR